jgi:hypothetical protein
MTRSLIATRIRVQKVLEARGDAGQGTMEYVGMLIAVAVVVAAVATVLKATNLGDQVTQAFSKAFGGS